MTLKNTCFITAMSMILAASCAYADGNAFTPLNFDDTAYSVPNSSTAKTSAPSSNSTGLVDTNAKTQNAIGNAELDSFYIEGAGWLVPLLENQGDEEIKILKWCLEQLTRGFVYSTSDILNSLPTITVRDGHLYFECLDVQWNDYSEDKQVDTSRLFPSAAMFFVPYIWKSLYPIVKERYHGNMEDEREVNLHGQAA